MLKALQETVTVTENGKRRRVPKIDVAAKQLVNKGAAGDIRATKLALDLAQKAEARAGEAEARSPVMTESDREICARIVERLTRLIREADAKVSQEESPAC